MEKEKETMTSEHEEIYVMVQERLATYDENKTVSWELLKEEEIRTC